MNGLLDFLQGASNTAASNVSGPVDLIGMGLRKLGVPVPQNALLSSQWMEERGLTRKPKNALAAMAGETVGLLSPVVAAAKAPQIARGLLAIGENAAAPASMNVGMASGQRGMVEAGKPFTYIRNTEKSPNFGSRFGQDIEPHGRYLLEDTAGVSAKLPPSWESGQLTFKNPLVIDWGGEYGSSSNWKNKLSEMFGGKKGAALSRAISKKGHDGIVTIRDGETSEIVDLTMMR